MFDCVPLALAGVFATEPGHQIPTSLLPDGHPIRGQVTAAMLYLHDDLGAELPKPGSGWIEADGAHVLRAPSLRGAILQSLDGQGAVLATHYRWPDEVGFEWVVPVAGSSVATANVRGPRATVQRPDAGEWAHRAPGVVLSGASLVTSGVLYALAAEGRAEFDAHAPCCRDMPQQRSQPHWGEVPPAVMSGIVGRGWRFGDVDVGSPGGPRVPRRTNADFRRRVARGGRHARPMLSRQAAATLTTPLGRGRWRGCERSASDSPNGGAARPPPIRESTRVRPKPGRAATCREAGLTKDTCDRASPNPTLRPPPYRYRRSSSARRASLPSDFATSSRNARSFLQLDGTSSHS